MAKMINLDELLVKARTTDANQTVREIVYDITGGYGDYIDVDAVLEEAKKTPHYFRIKSIVAGMNVINSAEIPHTFDVPELGVEITEANGFIPYEYNGTLKEIFEQMRDDIKGGLSIKLETKEKLARLLEDEGLGNFAKELRNETWSAEGGRGHKLPPQLDPNFIRQSIAQTPIPAQEPDDLEL